MFAPHLASHHLGGIAAVTDGHGSGVVDEVRYLLGVAGASRRKENGCELPSGIACCMQFKAIVPALVVFAKGGNALGYSVAVSPNELADMEHS